MPPTVANSIDRLDEAIPLSKAAAWDAVGLQVGDSQAVANVVGVCHEVTDQVAAAAADRGVDLLVSYHPLLFRPATSFVAGASAGGRAFHLAAAGVALYVVHTSFDVAAGGCADALASALDLDGAAGFGVGWPSDSAKVVTYAPGAAVDEIVAAMAQAGAGDIGSYGECAFTLEGVGRYRPRAGASPAIGTRGEMSRQPEIRIEMNLPRSRLDRVVAALAAAHPYEEPAYDVYSAEANAGFVGRIGDLAAPMTLDGLGSRVAAALSAVAKLAGDPERQVRRVAVVPGSGSDFLGHATAAGADVIVTGDVSHHRARDALASGLAVIDAGHAATERPGLARLYSLVSEMFADTIDMTHLNPDPWGSARWRS